MKTNISVKILFSADHVNFERNVKRIIVAGIFYFWSVLKRIKSIN